MNKILETLKTWIVNTYNFLKALPSFLLEAVAIILPLMLYEWLKGKAAYTDGVLDGSKKEAEEERKLIKETKDAIVKEKDKIDKDLKDLDKKEKQEEDIISKIEEEKKVEKDYSNLDDIDNALNKYGI